MPVIPTLHLNGTSCESLLDQLHIASSSLRTAIEALTDAAPHGRDYHPQGNEAWRKAIQEHVARLEALNRVQKEITEIYEGILTARQEQNRE
jgi:hypothetical protein